MAIPLEQPVYSEQPTNDHTIEPVASEPNKSSITQNVSDISSGSDRSDVIMHSLLGQKHKRFRTQVKARTRIRRRSR